MVVVGAESTAQATARVTALDVLRELTGRGAPRAPDLDSLEAWGRAFGAAVASVLANNALASVIVSLSGDLGVGKTTLARAICSGIGVTAPSSVTSPTFALLQQYNSAVGVVVHADLYRLKGPSELDALGWDEIVGTAPVLLVEWPDRAEGTLPEHTIAIELWHDIDHVDRRALSVRMR